MTTATWARPTLLIAAVTPATDKLRCKWRSCNGNLRLSYGEDEGNSLDVICLQCGRLHDKDGNILPRYK